MKTSLQLKIFISFLIVIFFGVGLVGFLANRATVDEFSSYMASGGNIAKQEIAGELSRYYLENNGWHGVEAQISKISRLGYYVALFNPQGIRIAEAGDFSRAHFRNIGTAGCNSYVFDGKGRVIGLLEVYPTDTELRTPAERNFISSVNRSLLIAAFLAVLFSIAISFAISRVISNPIKGLTQAVSSMSKGELRQKVETSGTDEVGELSNAFNNLSTNLSEVEQLRRNMISDIAHELRTPITALQGHIEGMADGVIETSKENLDSVHQEILLLSRLVNDLQDLSLLEAGQLSLNKSPFSVFELIKASVKAFEPKAKKEKVEIITDIDKGLGKISADKDRMRQIFQNLISNALRHTSKNGTIEITAGLANDKLKVCVKDNGSGINEKDLPYIFERFYRAEKSRGRKTGGAGLGLTIVKRLVEAHGGTIGAESQKGKGTAITFEIPVKS